MSDLPNEPVLAVERECLYTAARKCGAWRGVAGGEIV